MGTMNNFKWYRRFKGGVWYQHQFTQYAQWICSTWTGKFWVRYGEINKYSNVIKEENYTNKTNITINNNNMKPTSNITFWIISILIFLLGIFTSHFFRAKSKYYPIEVQTYVEAGNYSYNPSIECDSVISDTIWKDGVMIRNKNMINVIFK